MVNPIGPMAWPRICLTLDAFCPEKGGSISSTICEPWVIWLWIEGRFYLFSHYWWAVYRALCKSLAKPPLVKNCPRIRKQPYLQHFQIILKCRFSFLLSEHVPASESLKAQGTVIITLLWHPAKACEPWGLGPRSSLIFKSHHLVL